VTAPKAPRGTNDWWGEAAARRRAVIDAGRTLFEAAGYREIVTPTFEDTAIYARTAGSESDVVQKEMYTFEDRGGRSLTLRPEGTAGVMRAYLEHGLSRQAQPVKVWYCAPNFRYAAVQRGRFREHYQFGVEAIGSDDPAVDAEIIALQRRWLARPGVAAELELNSIGDAACRPAYLERLRAFLDERADRLCAECRERRHANPLRVLDCKNPACREATADAPRITDALCGPCREHFAAVRAFLDAAGVAYRVEPRLVRGLDYYTRTAWEFTSAELGAQSAVGGGGRYDGLAEQLGGPATPGVGFGSGIERILELSSVHPSEPPLLALFAIVHEPARPRLLALLDELRARGHAADFAAGSRRLKRALEQAARRDARLAVIVGEDEWARGVATVRDMNTGEQRAIPLDRLVEELLR
jgi:histidyl-tRNA synthetase